MIAEMIYNSAVENLNNLVKDLLNKFYNKDKESGLVDYPIEDGYTLDIWDFGKEFTNVIVWCDDCYYTDGPDCKAIDCSTIYFDGKNIILTNEDNDYPFMNLPMNSMVYVASVLEEICEENKIN